MASCLTDEAFERSKIVLSLVYNSMITEHPTEIHTYKYTMKNMHRFASTKNENVLINCSVSRYVTNTCNQFNTTRII